MLNGRLLRAAMTVTAVFGAPLFAEDLTPAQEGALVFSSAKDLGASVERILMHSCYLTAGHDNGYADWIAQDIAVFEQTTVALKEGDANTGLPATKARGTLLALSRAEEEWRDFSDFARFATRGAMSEPYFVRMYDLHTRLLADVKSVSDRISAKYSGARIGSWTSTTLINLADLRTDATLLATYHCMLSENIRPEDARAKMEERYTLLQAGVQRAIEGVSDERLHKASEDKRVYLECVIATITELETYIVPALEPGYRPSPEELLSAKEHMNELLRVSNGALDVFFSEMMGEAPIVSGCVSDS